MRWLTHRKFRSELNGFSRAIILACDTHSAIWSISHTSKFSPIPLPILEMEGYAAVNRDFDRSGDNGDQKLLSADPSYNIHRATRCITRRAILCELIALLIAFSSGYLVSHKIDPRTAQNQGPISLSSSRQLFTYNRTFSNPPSVETNQAWTDLFPARGGFFTHPTLAPDLSVVAVFHQLHCIVGSSMLGNESGSLTLYRMRLDTGTIRQPKSQTQQPAPLLRFIMEMLHMSGTV